MGKRPDFLLRAINSILSQNFNDWELIIKTNGAKISVPVDKRIIVFDQPDKNLGEALNQGFGHARGEILNESNDDDEMSPGTLQFISGNMGDAKWAYGKIMYGNQPFGQPWDFERFKQDNFVPQPAVFFTREAFEKTEGFDEEHPLAADYDMWLQLGKLYTPKFFERVLAQYNVHPGQLTRTDTSKQIQDGQLVRQKHL